MPVLNDWTIDLTLDEVFAFQGVDGGRILQRNPRLYELTQEALAAAPSLLIPQMVFSTLRVRAIHNDMVLLEYGYTLSSATVAEQFTHGEYVTAAVCTIGDRLEQAAGQAMGKNQHAYGYALDSAGTVALDKIVEAFYASCLQQAQEEDRIVSHRFSPGLEDWPLDQGQPEIFNILREEALPVELLPSFQMRPLKSLSFVFAAGKNLIRSGKACDYCGMRERCAQRSLQEGQHVCTRALHQQTGKLVRTAG
jgi:hypothetical protein